MITITDKEYALRMADIVTATMRREDKREDGRDVIYAVAESAPTRLCPHCKRRKLHPTTWIIEVGNPNRVLAWACIHCSGAVFEAHPENGKPFDLKVNT